MIVSGVAFVTELDVSAAFSTVGVDAALSFLGVGLKTVT